MGLVQLNKNFNNLPKTFSEDLEGQWIAVLDGKIVRKSPNFRELFRAVKEEFPNKPILFHKVPKKEIIIV